MGAQHMVRVISVMDDDWPAVIRNMTKARIIWQRMSRILIREGVSPRVSVFFFKAVVQSVLLFSAETWVVIPRMGRFLGFFHDQAERRLTGRMLQRRLDGSWDYNSAEAAREEARFETMETYIL